MLQKAKNRRRNASVFCFSERKYPDFCLMVYHLRLPAYGRSHIKSPKALANQGKIRIVNFYRLPLTFSPAAVDTITRFFADTGEDPSSYDAIATGDLGNEGLAIAKELFAKPDVDGGLIGGAALKVDSFKGIIDAWK